MHSILPGQLLAPKFSLSEDRGLTLRRPSPCCFPEEGAARSLSHQCSNASFSSLFVRTLTPLVQERLS